LDDTYGFVMLFTGDPLPDVDRRSIAIEPMTCPPNALATGTDLIRLEPGATWTGRWGIEPRPNA
jgi:aldose 1-epimerase